MKFQSYREIESTHEFEVMDGKFIMKKMIIARRILLCAIFLLFVVFIVSHYDSKEYTVKNEQEYLNKICEMTGIPAMSVGIMDKDMEIYLNYSSDDNVIINEKSLYELASTTKAFTALGILQLEKNGKLNFTDSVDQYISWFSPEFEGRKATITIGQLLEHTSGIPAWTICLIPSGTSENTNLIKTIEQIKNVKLKNEPGKVHEYATINYDILALIIQEITGQKYEDYIQENVLEPIEMQNSFFRTDYFSDEITQGNKVSFLQTKTYDAPVYYGNIAAGYLVSNTSDLMKWMKNVNELFNFDGFVVTNTTNYYAGWNVYDDYVSHSGNNPNYCSQVIIRRDNELGVFVLSALSGSSATDVADNIYRMHSGEKIKIGLYIDNNVLLDFICIIAILILIYLMMLIQINSKRKAVLSLIIGTTFILGVTLFSFLSHYNYCFLYVWCPISFFVLLLTAIGIAIIQICNSVIWLKNKNAI